MLVYIPVYVYSTQLFTTPTDDAVIAPAKRIKGKGKAVPVTGGESFGFPHFLANRHTDGGKVSPTRRRPLPPPAPQEDSWYSFMLEAASTPGP
jgi:hypothetical protein